MILFLANLSIIEETVPIHSSPVDENDHAYFETHYSNLSFNELSDALVVPRIDADTIKMLEAYQSQNSFQYCIQLMSIPEYQLC